MDGFKKLRSFNREEAKLVFGVDTDSVMSMMSFKTREVGIFNWTKTMMKKYSMIEYIRLVKKHGLSTIEKASEVSSCGVVRAL